MADKSKIEWTDATWNPIRGCSRVSEGCRFCYAEPIAARFSGEGQPYQGLAEFVTKLDGSREARWTGVARAVLGDSLMQPLRWKRPRKIFVNSMSDLFHETLPDEAIDRVFAVMALCPQHVFQVLTKRPGRMKAYFDDDLMSERVGVCMGEIGGEEREGWYAPVCDGKRSWVQMCTPLPNVWLGVSCEDQPAADERIPLLLRTPAAVRFISAEPLLGPIVLADSVKGRESHGGAFNYVDWVIVGGESGPRARPMHPNWARWIRDECAAASVPFFFKQWGEWVSVHEAAGLAINADDVPYGEWHRAGGFVESCLCGSGNGTVVRVGKKTAGHLLDGREWRTFPEVRS